MLYSYIKDFYKITEIITESKENRRKVNFLSTLKSFLLIYKYCNGVNIVI